jgi:hypothetical protein
MPPNNVTARGNLIKHRNSRARTGRGRVSPSLEWERISDLLARAGSACYQGANFERALRRVSAR